MQDVLVLVGGLGPGLADALVGPADLGPPPGLELGLGLRVLLVVLPGVPPRRLALLQVAGVAAAVQARLLLREVERLVIRWKADA